MCNVIPFDKAARAAREVDSLAGMYGYGKAATGQFRRNAIHRVMHDDEPAIVAAHRSVPRKSRRLGDGPTPPEAA